MGGYNSGRWFYHDKKHTVNQHSHISANTLPEPGQRSGNSVVKVERAWGSVTITYHGMDELMRKMACDILGKPYKALERPDPPIYHKVIPLTSLRRNLGGSQVYFVCPGCNRRAVKLYWRYSRFACRTCQDLTYVSCQRAHENDRGSGYVGLLKGMYLANELREKAAKLEDKYRRCKSDSKAQQRLWLRLMRLWEKADRLMGRFILVRQLNTNEQSEFP